MLPTLLLGTIALFVAGDAKDDQKKLEGTWTVASAEVGGVSAPAEAIKDMKWVFAGDKLTISDKNGPKDATYKLDPSKKPAAIDMSRTDKGETKTLHGIYEVDGDTLKICLAMPGGERPTEFAGKGATGLFVLKRAKP